MQAPFLTSEILIDSPRQHFQAGDSVIAAGQATDKAYLVSAGTFVSARSGQVWQKGDVVCLPAFLALDAYIDDIRADSTSTVILIPRGLFKMASDRENRMTWPLSICLASASTRMVAQ